MLLAVEGGGFFSSSASGYSKGLQLLFLSQKNEDKPMRVAPWTQYQLVEQETDPGIQLASGKNGLIRGCTSFVCFGRAATAATRPDNPCPLNVRPAQNVEIQQGSQEFEEDKDDTQSNDPTVIGADGDNSNRKIGIIHRSSVKKSVDTDGGGVDGDDVRDSKTCDLLCESGNDVICETERKKVQWADTSGGELFEIREFEMSDDGSDYESAHANRKTCGCRLM